MRVGYLRARAPSSLREEGLPGPYLNATLEGALAAAVLGDADVPRGDADHAALIVYQIEVVSKQRDRCRENAE